VHAGCVAHREAGIVMPGPSGAGKSTLVVGLVREGLAFVSDDMVFLTGGPGDMEVHAFPGTVAVSPATEAMFPELKVSVPEPGRTGRDRPKRAFRIDEVFAATTLSRCAPRALVFPSVAHSDRSVLTPIGSDQALLELVPNVVLTEAASSQAHLDAMGTLVQTTPSWRLATGRDFGRVAAMLRELVT
jgi:hypothetical protein